MLPLLAQIFIGWPAILGSLGISSLGIVRKQPGWLFGGAVLVLGSAWYLSAWPHPVFSSVGFSLPFLHAGAAVAVQRGRIGLAWMLLVPQASIAAVLGSIVLMQ